MRGGDPNLLGEVSIVFLGGGFRVIPETLGDLVEEGCNPHDKSLGLRGKPVSLVAMAGGTHYVEALVAALCYSRVERIYVLGVVVHSQSV